MIASLARRAAIPALLLALPVLTVAQSISIGSANQVAEAQSGSVEPSLRVLEQGLVLGSWLDSTTFSLGSMTADLYDQSGELSFQLIATVSEYIANGSGDRFGGIAGELYIGIVPTGIFVDGTWDIDGDTDKGSYELDFYMGGQTPMAPVLAVGSADGRISAPTVSQGGREAVPQRAVIGRWTVL